MADDKQPEEALDAKLVSGPAESPADEQNLVLARHVLPPQLPIIPLTRKPLFPKMTVPMLVEQEALKRLLADIAKSELSSL